MSSPTADPSAALPPASSELTFAAPGGGPTFTRDYRTGTVRSSLAATPCGKQLTLLAGLIALSGLGLLIGYTMPPTPKPLEIHEAGIQPGGFLPGMFQVPRPRPQESLQSQVLTTNC